MLDFVHADVCLLTPLLRLCRSGHAFYILDPIYPNPDHDPGAVRTKFTVSDFGVHVLNMIGSPKDAFAGLSEEVKIDRTL